MGSRRSLQQNQNQFHWPSMFVHTRNLTLVSGVFQYTETQYITQITTPREVHVKKKKKKTCTYGQKKHISLLCTNQYS